MELVRLTQADYDEWLQLLNYVFGRKNQRDMNFEQELPKMCVRDEAHMAKHLAIREDGKLVAVVGIYPFPVQIGEDRFLFSTVGNVVTLPEYEGRGYMQMLFSTAMEELERMGVDASRLGGVRQRYNRFGYEACGSQYSFTVNSHGRSHCMAPDTPKLRFVQVGPEDHALLEAMEGIHARDPMRVLRAEEGGTRGVYDVLTAWRNVPYAALTEDGKVIGSLTVSEAGDQIAEVCAVDPEALKAVIYRWQERLGKDIRFTLPAFEVEGVRYFTGCAAASSLSSPCHFKFLRYDRVANALMQLKRELMPGLPTGEYFLGIEGWGTLRLYAENDRAGCEKTDRKPQAVLNRLEASRLLFGPWEPEQLLPYHPFLKAWLPLPLSWNTLDRV